MSDDLHCSVALPNQQQAARLSQWLYAARVRLLRQAQIPRRSRILELGAGWSFAAEELQRRSGGEVTLVDCDPRTALSPPEMECPRIHRVVANAENLPFEDRRFDLIFAQFAFLWFSHVERAVAEANRVLTHGGAMAFIEPDYGGLMEYPFETAVRTVWLAALRRVGADPFVGRRLPWLLEQSGLRVRVSFLDRLEPAASERWEFLQELPLTGAERARVDAAKRAAEQLDGSPICHLPCWLILAEKGETL